MGTRTLVLLFLYQQMDLVCFPPTSGSQPRVLSRGGWERTDTPCAAERRDRRGGVCIPAIPVCCWCWHPCWGAAPGGGSGCQVGIMSLFWIPSHFQTHRPLNLVAYKFYSPLLTHYMKLELKNILPSYFPFVSPQVLSVWDFLCSVNT